MKKTRLTSEEVKILNERSRQKSTLDSKKTTLRMLVDVIVERADQDELDHLIEYMKHFDEFIDIRRKQEDKYEFVLMLTEEEYNTIERICKEDVNSPNPNIVDALRALRKLK